MLGLITHSKIKTTQPIIKTTNIKRMFKHVDIGAKERSEFFLNC